MGSPAPDDRSPQRRRLVAAAVLATGVLVGSTVVPTHGAALTPDGPGIGAPVPPLADDGHAHDHTDPSTKNAVSRAGDDDPAAVDRTTLRERFTGARAVARQRAERDPALVPVAKRPDRRRNPEDRYAMAGGCYALRSTTTGAWVARNGAGYAATAAGKPQAEPFHFQATDLGKYLLVGRDDTFVARDAGIPPLQPASVAAAAAPSHNADWIARRSGSTYTFGLPSGDRLALDGNGGVVLAPNAERFALRTTTGCTRWDEVQTNVSGRTFRGVSTVQETRGYVDAHTHGMAFEFLGGRAHCGRPWHPYGVELALEDCPDHTVTGGYGALLETALSERVGHDPVGWPTFKDWPRPDSLTHEGTYWKWMERSWRGGLRLFVNLLVENNKLCELYPLKKNSCDDMDSIRLQAQQMRAFERYIDAQYGGPGEGWYRIVTNPFQARRVVNRGKLAVVMGIETSVPFKCSMKADVPQCDKATIDAQLAEVHRMGVRQMELVNKFDNALSGVAGDEGTTGLLVNTANFLETGSYWAMEHCPGVDGRHDKAQYAAPAGIDPEQQDALFGAIARLSGVQPAPAYGPPEHCNRRGLTDLGRHLIGRLAQRGMIFDPDHMSVAGRDAALDLLEQLRYPGVISSHSWSTPDAYPRIYRLGGTVMPYAGDSTGFVEKWRRHLTWADPRYYFGFGYGADMNGLGAQGDPRGAGVPNPVTYPFTGLGGVKVNRNVSGERVYDVNVDGVAHYGLYPDWVEDLRKVADSSSPGAGAQITDDMARGVEAYLQMWERAVGVSNDACRDPAAAKRASVIRDLPKGASVNKVLRTAGQPHQRLDDTFSYCATKKSGATTKVKVFFDGRGRVTRTR
jgi:microsomal dipeptidase-like Zn-dependent dipeptidase